MDARIYVEAVAAFDHLLLRSVALQLHPDKEKKKKQTKL